MKFVLVSNYYLLDREVSFGLFTNVLSRALELPRVQTNQPLYRYLSAARLEALQQAAADVNRPVTSISLRTIDGFRRALDNLTTITNEAITASEWRFDLPYDDEWRVAADRGLQGTAGWFSTKGATNVASDSHFRNQLGIYDLYGNVAEVCRQRSNPTNYQTIGGSFMDRVTVTSEGNLSESDLVKLAKVSAAERGGFDDLGFRCVLRLKPSSP